MLSLGIYGLMMAGWSSANNYALLGGQRAAALMISAEIAIGASIMGVVMVYGSLNMQDIARAQGQPLLPQYFGNWIPAWGILTQPLAFFLFLTAGIAATKRIPFDMPEGESEIIGYFVEYSGMKFGMFAMADFLETVVIAGMTTGLFLGGSHQGRRPDLVPHADPLDAAALSLRPGDAAGLAGALPALHP